MIDRLDAAARAFAFDFDGVIVDSMPPQERAWRAAVRHVLKNDSLADAFVQNLYAGKAGQAMFDGIRLSRDQKKRLRARKDARWSRARSDVPLMRGADRVIPRLADRFPIAITTTADRAYVTHVLSRERLDRHIELIVTNADVPRPKPAPDMLDTVARYFGIKMNRLWLVGDTDADRDMAGAARAKFIHFGSAGTASRSRSVIAVESWRELARLLGA